MRLFDFDVVRNDGVEEFVFKVPPDDREGVFRDDPFSVAGDDGAEEFHGGVEVSADGFDRILEEGEPLEGEIIRAQGDQNFLARREGVDGQQAERGGRVDQDHVVVERFYFVLKDFFSADELRNLKVDPREKNLARDDVDAERFRTLDHFLERDFGEKKVASAQFELFVSEEGGGGRSLWVEVDEKNFFAEAGQLAVDPSAARRRPRRRCRGRPI